MMKTNWTWILGLLVGCAGAQQQPVEVASAPAEEPEVVASEQDATADAEKTDEVAAGAEAPTESPAKQAPKPASYCKPKPDAEPKVVTGDDMASDLGETGRTFILNVAGISVEFPPCTPEVDTEVLELSWETQERPTSSHVHPDFSRHGATVRLPYPIRAAEGAPLRLRFNSHRPLTKAGHKFVAAVEFSGACEGRFKRDPLEYDTCSHWRVFDANFDADVNEMVAEVPEIGGYRIQFGWMPKGK